ncbi:MAG: hypothetical protein NWF04_03295 [Candidatus Bathyarchaeota archaeon]|nr:hypothetical protein [Candidatus Bathyarchaeota archaeon]
MKRALQKPHILESEQCDSVRSGVLADPVAVHDADGKEAYWLVPMLHSEKACGFAHVNQDLSVSKIATFGSGPKDTASWVDAAFFKQPPPEALKEIRARYPDMELSEPLFSYDKTPDKWGWKITLKNGDSFNVFVGVFGWYKQSEQKPGFEG